MDPGLHWRLALLLAGAIGLDPRPAAPSQARDGQHDFDFELGTWHTQLRRLVHPLTGSTTWVEMEGTTVVRKVWDGRANLVELVADGGGARFEGMSLRLYNPAARQWSLNFANAADGVLSTPTIGEFRNRVGEFYDQEPLRGRAILVRFVIRPLTPDSIRFEQSFSDDGGRTWELNWVATDTRVKAASSENGESRLPEGDRSHDFDFELGKWSVHQSQLLHPLTGSTTWIQYDGTVVATPIWNGRGDLVELESAAPSGHAEGLLLRLYNPQAHQWSVSFASSRTGTLSPPATGAFRKGRAVLVDLETVDGRTVLARSELSDISANSYRLAQSFSADGGATWEKNWISVHTRTLP